MSLANDANDKLAELARRHPACLLFYSGGKDSLAACELAHRHFRRVVGVHMYFVPGLDITKGRIDYAKQRWGMDCLLLPHWVLSRFLKRGIYCMPRMKIKEMTLSHVQELARHQTGIKLIISGHRRSDGTWMRRRLSQLAGRESAQPLAKWSKLDVLAFLKAQAIDLPEAIDLDLSTPSLLALHDRHPEDFQRVEEVFPHVRAVIWRREWFGVEGKAKAR